MKALIGKVSRLISKNRLLLSILLLLSLVYLFRIINYRNELYVLHDEFAYWGIAAKWSGYSWYDMLKDSSYYSYGYSLLLVPLFLLKLEPDVMYKMAITVNILLIGGTFLLSYSLGKKIFPGLNSKKIILSCAVITFFPYVAMQTNYALPEILLYFSYWMLTYLLYSYFETSKGIKAILAIFLSVMMFYIHQRAIAIIIATTVVLLFWWWNNKTRSYYKKNRKMILGVILVIVFALLLNAIKKYNLNNVFWSNDIVQINDFSGQTHKIIQLLSIQGIVDLFRSLAGKYYYFCVSTVLVGSHGFICLVLESIKGFLRVVKRRATDREIFKLFLVLSFLGMIFITAIFMLIHYGEEPANVRLDQIFYGRYFEFVLGPILLYGLYKIIWYRPNKILLLINLILFAVSTMITDLNVHSINPIGKVDMSAPGFNYFFWNESEYTNIILHGFLLTALIYCIIVSLTIIKKKNFCYISLVIICLWWMYQNRENDKIIIQREEENQKYVYTAVDYLKENLGKQDLRYIYTSEDANKFQRYAFYIQFNLYEKEMKKVDVDINGISIEENIIYLLMDDSSLKEYFDKNCKNIFSNERVYLYRLN